VGRRRHPKREHGAAPAPVTDDLVDWVDYCGGRMIVVGYTEGGAPFGAVNWDANDSFNEEHTVGHVIEVDDGPF
jgi:hypothetical protein